MFDKIKSRLWPLVNELQDVRMLGWIAFCIIALLVSWSGAKVIQTNYDLQKQISTLQQQNNIQELENNNLKLTNEYYNTNEFLELAARRQFGKGAPGETLLLVPKSVALAHAVNLPTASAANNAAPKQSGYHQNWQAWLDFFRGRQNTD